MSPSRQWSVEQNGLGIGCFNATVFHIVEVTPIDAPAAQSVLPAAFKPKVVNLLVGVNNSGFISGKWETGPDGLTCIAEGNKMRFDYQPPGEYDMRVVFTRVDGNGVVLLALVHGEKRFSWDMGAWGDKSTGFGRVKEKLVGSNDASVKGRSGLQNGHKYECIVKVRHDGVAAYLDGKLLVQYATDYSDMTPRDAWDIGGTSLGLGGGTQTIFHSVEVSEIGK